MRACVRAYREDAESNGSVSYPVQSDSGPLRYGSCASLVAVEVKISLFFFARIIYFVLVLVWVFLRFPPRRR